MPIQAEYVPWMRASPSGTARTVVSDLGCRKVVATPPGLPPRLKAYAPATHSTPCYSATPPARWPARDPRLTKLNTSTRTTCPLALTRPSPSPWDRRTLTPHPRTQTHAVPSMRPRLPCPRKACPAKHEVDKTVRKACPAKHEVDETVRLEPAPAAAPRKAAAQGSRLSDRVII